MMRFRFVLNGEFLEAVLCTREITIVIYILWIFVQGYERVKIE